MVFRPIDTLLDRINRYKQYAMPTSFVPPNVSISLSAPDAPQMGSEKLNGGRRHTRLHSRNLSFFFPRPGTNPRVTINEDDDDAQELEVPVDVEAPLIPSAGSNINFPGSRSPRPPLTPLGQVGGRPPSSSSQGLTPDLMTAGPHSGSSRTSSRPHPPL